MSSVEEIEVKVDEKGAAESTPAAAAEDASAAEKSNGDVSVAEKKSSPERENGDDEVVVAKVEKSMESKPERARKTILSEMCDHSKPQKGPPSFQVHGCLVETLSFRVMRYGQYTILFTILFTCRSIF